MRNLLSFIIIFCLAFTTAKADNVIINFAGSACDQFPCVISFNIAGQMLNVINGDKHNDYTVPGIPSSITWYPNSGPSVEVVEIPIGTISGQKVLCCNCTPYVIRIEYEPGYEVGTGEITIYIDIAENVICDGCPDAPSDPGDFEVQPG
ncbi:hypothetical protein GC194_11845 [bacterium]|nr:hypothetical protein [bacterium]